MPEFYSMPNELRLIYSVFAAFCVMASALCLILHSFRFRFGRGLLYWHENALSALALCQSLTLTALIAQVQLNTTEGGFAVPSGYVFVRYAVFAAAIIVSVYPCIKGEFALPGLALLPSFLTLPAVETWMDGFFPAAYTAALVVQLCGGVWFTATLYKELKTSISGLSVKQAMDALNTAVLFYKENGHILLQNEKMQELMAKTAGRVLYNGKIYLEKTVIANGEHTPGGSYLYRISDSAWLFTAKKIMLGKTPVTQLTAADVTEQHRVNLLLQDRQKELKEQQERLKALVENIGGIRRSEELLRVRAEFHDAHNKKLTALLRYLREGRWPPGDVLAAAGASLVQGIKESESGKASGSPQAELDALIGGYMKIGVKIAVEGPWPADGSISFALLAILREAAANAIIHGYADEITAATKNENGYLFMRVTDNSRLAPKMKREGSGIAEMRRRLAAFGGELGIETEERFILTVKIPQKEGELA